MKNKFILCSLIFSSFFILSCFKGEAGPVGPAGQNGVDGRNGQNGLNGESVDKPNLTGLFRVYLKGTDPFLTKTDIDSSQFLFLSKTWTFRLYKLNQDSCNQVNLGTVEWGGSTLVMTDSSLNSHSYATQGYYSGSYFTGSLPDNFLNCLKCELRPVSACSQSTK